MNRRDNVVKALAHLECFRSIASGFGQKLVKAVLKVDVFDLEELKLIDGGFSQIYLDRGSDDIFAATVSWCNTLTFEQFVVKLFLQVRVGSSIGLGLFAHGQSG